MQNAIQQISWQDDGGSGGDKNHDDKKLIVKNIYNNS